MDSAWHFRSSVDRRGRFQIRFGSVPVRSSASQSTSPVPFVSRVLRYDSVGRRRRRRGAVSDSQTGRTGTGRFRHSSDVKMQQQQAAVHGGRGGCGHDAGISRSTSRPHVLYGFADQGLPSQSRGTRPTLLLYTGCPVAWLLFFPEIFNRNRILVKIVFSKLFSRFEQIIKVLKNLNTNKFGFE